MNPSGVLLMKIPVHIEAALVTSTISKSSILSYLQSYLRSHCPVFTDGLITLKSETYSHSGGETNRNSNGNSSCCESNSDNIKDCIAWVRVTDLQGQIVSFWQADLKIHVFQLSEQPPERDYMTSGGGSNSEDENSAFELWELPNTLLLGQWESIVIDSIVKKRLLGYCDTSLRFADAGVDATLISWNRIALLHGPPGSGKTSLCRALAQKLFIRNCDRYESGVLLEINAHSLFSKWFSESGKLVMKLFDHINDTADDDTSLVCVLIDEVESIASARSSSMMSNEPGDAVRVVNAVLTSLDALKRRSNVMVLCTSNMVDAMDPAFLDRIDMKVMLGPPPLSARYEILKSCLEELMRREIIIPTERIGRMKIPPSIESGLSAVRIAETESEAISTSGPDGATSVSRDEAKSNECLLYDLAQAAEGMSGRSLRKLPVKAHAYFICAPTATLGQFMFAMSELIAIESTT